MPFGSMLRSPRIDESVQQDAQSYIYDDDLPNLDKSQILPNLNEQKGFEILDTVYETGFNYCKKQQVKNLREIHDH